MASEVCRRCGAALPLRTDACPLCGLVNPRPTDLTNWEMHFTQSYPELPPDYSELLTQVEVHQSLGTNLVENARQLALNPDSAPLIWAGIGTVILGLATWLLFSGAWFSYLLFWPGFLFLLYQSFVLTRSVAFVHRFKRLRRTRSLAPYSVHFRMEKQLRELLSGLRTLVRSILERNWRTSGSELSNASDSFITAARVIVDRVRSCATPSLEIARIIWQNNVYSILESNMDPQEKAAAIGAKCREAEALLLRFRWLTQLPLLINELEQYIQKSREGAEVDPIAASDTLSRFNLGIFGPLEEGVRDTFERTPIDLLFMGRQFWLQSLLPGPLEEDESFRGFPQARALFQSLRLVRPLRTHLDEQMALNTAALALSTVSPLEGGMPTSAEARSVVRDAHPSHLINIPEFRPDAGQLNTEVDRLVSEARVALGTDQMFDSPPMDGMTHERRIKE